MIDQRPYTAPYHPGWDQRIRNIDALPPGTGARFLKCLIALGDDGALIAKSWHRREPEPERGYMVFTFPRRLTAWKGVETMTELSYDGFGINGPDKYRSRLATFATDEAGRRVRFSCGHARKGD